MDYIRHSTSFLSNPTHVGPSTHDCRIPLTALLNTKLNNKPVQSKQRLHQPSLVCHMGHPGAFFHPSHYSVSFNSSHTLLSIFQFSFRSSSQIIWCWQPLHMHLTALGPTTAFSRPQMVFFKIAPKMHKFNSP